MSNYGGIFARLRLAAVKSRALPPVRGASLASTQKTAAGMCVDAERAYIAVCLRIAVAALFYLAPALRISSVLRCPCVRCNVQVREHTELAWILGCVTPLGWLNRMTQFKSKAGEGRKAQESAVLGLYSYPVLQAADVLLYQGTDVSAPRLGSPLLRLCVHAIHALRIVAIVQSEAASSVVQFSATAAYYTPLQVPVGEDQLQHIELMRDIAMSFNRRFCAPVHNAAAIDAHSPSPSPHGASPPFSFVLPRAVSLPGAAAGGAGRIMSLRDGTRKMSKSDASDASRINLTDSDDAVRDKVRRAKTDSEAGFSYEPARRPDKSNLLAIYCAATGEPMDSAVARFAGASALAFKDELADAVVALVRPLRIETTRLLAEPAYLDAVLAEGAATARCIAEHTMAGVRAATGLAAPDAALALRTEIELPS